MVAMVEKCSAQRKKTNEQKDRLKRTNGGSFLRKNTMALHLENPVPWTAGGGPLRRRSVGYRRFYGANGGWCRVGAGFSSMLAFSASCFFKLRAESMVSTLGVRWLPPSATSDLVAALLAAGVVVRNRLLSSCEIDFGVGVTSSRRRRW